MPTFPETPARRTRLFELEYEPPVDVDSCGSDFNVGDGVVVAQHFDLQEDPSFWKENNVQVVIRIRPLSSSEMSLQGLNRCVRQDSHQSITWIGHPESRFTFDHVAGEQITQEQLFLVAGVPMVDNCVDGYNSCMFAYGQTGSGKTHTMLGDIESGTRRHSVNAGMTPRVFEYLFSRIQKERESRRDDKLRFVCKCSFLEIYNEQILDLLDPSSSNLQIREDSRKGIFVENLREFEVSCARDVMQQLIQGASNRKVASTNMNRASSRSHSVFTCTIESKWESQGVTHHRFSRLNLVDLAGSERQKSSGAEGERLKEATNINKSLSTLGLVIMNLVSVSNKKSLHVPYRDSKLTFLLQDSLGGNSKTIIIANISPSNCCTLETLSTLKFAQRAKFIRNNAIINEDASGDVIAMRVQIQQLKKEVSRLQGIINGGFENLEGDNMSVATDTPGYVRWDAGLPSYAPLTTNKKFSQRRDVEAVLVAAIKRDQEKDKAFKAMTMEMQATEQLAKQRSDEVQGLKMRLRFREERIKRLEAVSSRELSAEEHLLKEKEELVKELEVLRNQADRNRDATRFAMENLQLKEELRRLQSFVEDGERDMMNDQITMLQDKLLEALDWKLMHEKDVDTIQKSLDFSSSNEEMEFLRLQAIQNQREVDALRKNLSNCLEAKEKLERRLDDLVLQLQEKTPNNAHESASADSSSHPVASYAGDSSSEQSELKAMVEAIATASQREAEAHESAIMLAKENEELRVKLKVLFDDNSKLIQLCENLSTEGADIQNADAMSCRNTELSADEKCELENVKRQLHEMNDENEKLMSLYEQAMQDRDGKVKDLEQLQHQVQEMHEENDKLRCLYEQAMQEGQTKMRQLRDLESQIQELHQENKKIIGNYEKAVQEAQTKMGELRDLEYQIQELHQENKKIIGFYEKAIKERDDFEQVVSSMETCSKVNEEMCCPEKLVEVDEGMPYCNGKEIGSELKTECTKLEQNLNLIQSKLELVQKKFNNVPKIVNVFAFLEKETKELQIAADKLKGMYLTILSKHQEILSLQSSLSTIEKKKITMENNFLTLRSNCSRIQCFEKLELQSQARVDASSLFVERKKAELSTIVVNKQETDAACANAIKLEAQLKDELVSLKLKYQEAESKKKETERVLFAIDNLEKKDTPSQKSSQFGKAFELLKSEEERTILATQIKQSRTNLVALQKEISSFRKDTDAIDSRILNLKAEVRSGLILLEESQKNLEETTSHKKTLLEAMRPKWREVGLFLLDFQEAWFETYLKESEICACTQELQSEVEELQRLESSHSFLAGRCQELLDSRCDSINLECVCEMIQREIKDIYSSVEEALLLISLITK